MLPERGGRVPDRGLPYDVLVVGSLNMDLTLRVHRGPRPGETMLAKESALHPGGKGGNQAVAAARLGCRVRMLGLVGRDALGRELLEALRREGVDPELVTEISATTGMASIVVADDGENEIIVAQGANALLSPARIDAVPDAALAARVLLAQLEVPVETVLRAARRLRALGATVILNPAPAPEEPLPEEIWPLVDWVVPNRGEAERLTGERDPERAARQLLRLGPRGVVVTLGRHGALVAQGDRIERIPAVAVHAVDTTGAGDAFLGALAYQAALEPADPFRAARIASYCGALAATRPGAQTAPTLAEIREAGAPV